MLKVQDYDKFNEVAHRLTLLALLSSIIEINNIKMVGLHGIGGAGKMMVKFSLLPKR